MTMTSLCKYRFHCRLYQGRQWYSGQQYIHGTPSHRRMLRPTYDIVKSSWNVYLLYIGFILHVPSWFVHYANPFLYILFVTCHCHHHCVLCLGHHLVHLMTMAVHLMMMTRRPFDNVLSQKSELSKGISNPINNLVVLQFTKTAWLLWDVGIWGTSLQTSNLFASLFLLIWVVILAC